jgi:hypothetical protein
MATNKDFIDCGWRSDVRSKAADLSAKVANSSSITKLEALTIAPDKHTLAEFFNWPVDPREPVTG